MVCKLWRFRFFSWGQPFRLRWGSLWGVSRVARTLST